MTFIANTPPQQTEMLKACGQESIESLFKDIPAGLRARPLNIPQGKSELEVYSYFQNLAGMNYSHLTCFIGGGFYDHFIPAAVDALAGRSEFYTSYTPYQPELSQGILQSIYEYQTHICRLTELDVSNASLYEGGTALYEACQMAISATGRNKIVIDSGVNPIYRKMIYSYSSNLSIDFQEIPIYRGQSNR